MPRSFVNIVILLISDYNNKKEVIISMQNKGKTIGELNLEDDFLFAKVMSDKEKGN